MRKASVTLLLSALIAFTATLAVAATVYKWVDDKGVVHYSDQPHPDAQRLEVKDAQTYAADSGPSSSSDSSSGQSGAPKNAYSTCELFRPENDEVFMNTDTVVAKLRLEPQLLPGDRVALGIDGKRQTNQPTTGTDFTLTVERGTHTLIAVIENQAGKELCRSSAITFHVRQPSKQAPNRVNRPRF